MPSGLAAVVEAESTGFAPASPTVADMLLAECEREMKLDKIFAGEKICSRLLLQTRDAGSSFERWK